MTESTRTAMIKNTNEKQGIIEAIPDETEKVILEFFGSGTTQIRTEPAGSSDFRQKK